MFSLGAVLWFCADWGLPEEEEPVLSAALQSLIVEMTQGDPDSRPSLAELIQVQQLYNRPSASLALGAF